MSLYEALIALLGEVPVGYEPVAFALAACFAFYLITCMFNVLTVILRGGKW